ncbi:MAG TPA: DUF116 domain-containing protein [Syntrophobacteraceae bacterium]|nr:DUF116 domain-containing protein [Syntrophobacteraceae bacterium]
MTLVGLFGLTAVLILALLGLSYFIPYYGFGRIHQSLPILMALLIGGVGLLVLVAFVLLIVVTLLGRDVPFSQKLRSLVIKLLLPVLIKVGRLVGLRKEEVQHAFVALNNELVMAQCRNGHPPQKILLLMPHCLQNHDCPVKITYRVENCKRCGKCPIKDLLELASRYGVDLAVATGGTFARRIVIETRPDLIIAVACERDLTSGIQDTTPLPVYGIFNERPFGPCFDTRVGLEHVESILREVRSLKPEGS